MESRGRFKALNRDLIVDIMSRLDGATLNATSSTCTDLRDSARDEAIWQKLCHKTWPSTSMKSIMSYSNTGGFKSLYTDALPLILYEEASRGVQKQIDTSLSPWDVTSLVDIYYKGHSVFSKIVDGITHQGTCGENFRRDLSYPFELDLLGGDFQDFGSDIKNLHPPPFTVDKIARDIRMSWILLNKTNGKAVNISSWKPRSIHLTNSSEEDFSVYFGCIVLVEESIVNSTLTEFVVTVKFKLIHQEFIKWKEITLVIKDIDGSHLDGEQSIKVMNRALFCSRSVNRYKVEMGYQLFLTKKFEHKLKIEQAESLANMACAAVATAALLGICYACAIFLKQHSFLCLCI